MPHSLTLSFRPPVSEPHTSRTQLRTPPCTLHCATPSPSSHSLAHILIPASASASRMLLYHDDTELLLPYSPHLPIANLVPFTTTTDDITSSSCFSVACSKLVSLVLDLPSSSLGYQRVACCCTTLTGICTISLTERIHTHTVLLLLICASSACACMSLLSVGLSTSKGWGRLQYSQTAVPATCAFFSFIFASVLDCGM